MMGQSAAAHGNELSRMQTKLRNLEDRIRTMENKSNVVIGNWRLTQDARGDLIATNTASGKTLVIADKLYGEERES